MSTIAIIPARGGSKRFPNKNIALLNNKPLLTYSIEFALNNNDLIDEVVVSTNDPSVKSIAEKLGVTVIDRPEHLSGDNEPTITALQHVLQNQDKAFEHVVLLQATNPLRPVNLLKEAFESYRKGNYESLMTVSRNWQKFGKIQNDKFIPFNYEMGQRSQDLEPLYFENGMLYISKASLIKEGRILGEDNFPMIVEHPYAQIDIDEEEDLEWAAFALRKYNG
ncbi:MAG: acylneuraminate cytidylyltransferase family protein [Flavobacteriaceae bacterium]|nr:acylneuraminate cytidylyltransferase family protein [Flavobacteriaceae bacterium]